MKKHVIVAACFSALLAVNCGGEVDDPTNVGIDQEPFSDGSGALRGHEDILRFSIEFANTLLKSEFGVAGYWTPVPYGEACDSSHLMLHGNCATDSPDSQMTSYYGVSSSAWQTAGSVQDLHFLRDYLGTGVYGSKVSCQTSRDRIINATHVAMDKWAAGDRAGAEYWIGHATHIIQDSFSAAHTTRSGTLLRTMTDVCSYGRQVKGVCYHSLIDTRDRVWRSTLACQLDPNNRSWGCLTTQAQSAAYATGGYLRVIGRHVHSGFTTDLTATLNAWLDTASDGYAGYHSCSALK
jgi:hypothetical protein